MTEHADALPHGDIEEIADGVFWVRGSTIMGPGLRITRNMTVVRDGDTLTVLSAVRLSSDGEAELDRLGKVRHVVKLGRFHGMDDAYYLDRYGASYWALPDGAREEDPTPTETLAADHLPIGDAELFEFRGTKAPEAALLVKRAGGILVTCDAVQHWPDAAGCSLPAKLVTHLLGFRKRPAQIGPPWRKRMTPEGGSLREDFERLAALPFAHLIGGHGGLLRDDAKQALQATVEATF